MTDLTWTTQRRKISELIPHQNNPRKMSEKQVADLKRSIERFNFVEIPAIDTDNTILAGHQRLKVMQLLGRGEEEVEVRVPNRPLTKTEREEYLVRSNKNTGDWDFDLLAHFDAPILVEAGFTMPELTQHFGGDEDKKTEDGKCARCEELAKSVDGHERRSGHKIKKS